MVRLNCSENEEKEILEKLNTEEASLRLGGVILLCILLSCGIIGHFQVLIVFGRKMKTSNHTIFIIWLGVVDLTACLVGMPFLLVDLMHPLTFQADVLCKLARGTNYFLCKCSSFLMIVITIDRYRKVCHLLKWLIAIRKAKLACVTALCSGILVTMPAFLLFGQSSVTTETEYGTLSGVSCAVDDAYRNENYLVMYNVLVICLDIIFFYCKAL